MRNVQFLIVLGVTAVLTACGGGDNTTRVHTRIRVKIGSCPSCVINSATRTSATTQTQPVHTVDV